LFIKEEPNELSLTIFMGLALRTPLEFPWGSYWCVSHGDVGLEDEALAKLDQSLDTFLVEI